MDRISLDDLNRADMSGFVAALGDIFEHAPWVAQAAAAARPFPTLQALHTAMGAAVRNEGEDTRLELIRAHPDLAGKAALAGDLTAHSKAEQSGAGLDTMSPVEFETFHRLNTAYREKFGFPFIVCVRRHTRSSILAAFERRLANARAEEIATAVDEICRIAALRLDARVGAPDRLPVNGHLSTHVLDAHAGRPAAGVAVTLVELMGEGRERPVVEAVTNADGRTDHPLIAGRPLPIGTYELRFSIGAYFSARAVPLADPPFLDVVPVRFSLAEPEGRYHVPLLVTPWSYSTYRGS
jgi:2-oxo-4-hydroxy-4-carboxy-5-ureidoimidazoline decarboxylase